MMSQNALHDGQTDARTIELLLGVEALKRLAHARRVAGVEAAAVVPHEVHGLPALLTAAKTDARARLFAAEFPGVAQQILESDAQQARIGVQHEVWFNHELYLACRICRHELCRDRVHELGHT